MTTLESYGWNQELSSAFNTTASPGLIPARVVADFGTSVRLAAPNVISAELSGKLAHHSSRLDVPKIGDWVRVKLHDNGDAIVEGVIPRKNEIARRAAGNPTHKQIIAANVDLAFVILSLDKDFSIERLRRFLYQLSVSNVAAVIVLNKADKTENLEFFTEQLTSFGLPIITTIASDGIGIDALTTHIEPGKTVILLGSSGVGKSTLTNLLLGDVVQKTQATRTTDDTGRHTTVHRELFMLPGGGLLIDTPGIRELQLWGTEAALDDTFDDIAAFVTQCKYTSCTHGSEEGCAIQNALQSGELAKNRYEAFLKMKRELVVLKNRTVVRAKLNNRKSTATKKKRTRSELDDYRKDPF